MAYLIRGNCSECGTQIWIDVDKKPTKKNRMCPDCWATKKKRERRSNG